MDVILKSNQLEILIKKELDSLVKSGLIRRVSFFRERKTAIGRTKKVRVAGFALNPRFPYLKSLQNLLTEVMPFKASDFLQKLRRAGKVKLVVIAGIFIQDLDSRLDILVVGDKMKRHQIERLIRSIESDMGRELRYAILETVDFQYRLGICDKLIRDVFDYPYKKLLDLLDVQYR